MLRSSSVLTPTNKRVCLCKQWPSAPLHSTPTPLPGERSRQAAAEPVQSEDCLSLSLPLSFSFSFVLCHSVVFFPLRYTFAFSASPSHSLIFSLSLPPPLTPSLFLTLSFSLSICLSVFCDDVTKEQEPLLRSVAWVCPCLVHWRKRKKTHTQTHTETGCSGMAGPCH